jgi:hypothetical protein
MIIEFRLLNMGVQCPNNFNLESIIRKTGYEKGSKQLFDYLINNPCFKRLHYYNGQWWTDDELIEREA